MNVACSVQRTG